MSMDKNDLNCGNSGKNGNPIDSGTLDCLWHVYMLFSEFSFEPGVESPSVCIISIG